MLAFPPSFSLLEKFADNWFRVGKVIRQQLALNEQSVFDPEHQRYAKGT
jgi:hypothetical protein